MEADRETPDASEGAPTTSNDNAQLENQVTRNANAASENAENESSTPSACVTDDVNNAPSTSNDNGAPRSALTDVTNLPSTSNSGRTENEKKSSNRYGAIKKKMIERYNHTNVEDTTSNSHGHIGDSLPGTSSNGTRRNEIENRLSTSHMNDHENRPVVWTIYNNLWNWPNMPWTTSGRVANASPGASNGTRLNNIENRTSTSRTNNRENRLALWTPYDFWHWPNMQSIPPGRIANALPGTSYNSHFNNNQNRPLISSTNGRIENAFPGTSNGFDFSNIQNMPSTSRTNGRIENAFPGTSNGFDFSNIHNMASTSRTNGRIENAFPGTSNGFDFSNIQNMPSTSRTNNWIEDAFPGTSNGFDFSNIQNMPSTSRTNRQMKGSSLRTTRSTLFNIVNRPSISYSSERLGKAFSTARSVLLNSTNTSSTFDDDVDPLVLLNGLLYSGRDILPEEMLIEIFDKVDPMTLVIFQMVCKRWHDLIQRYIWRRKAQAAVGRRLPFDRNVRWSSYFYLSRMKFEYNLVQNPSGEFGLVGWLTSIDCKMRMWAVDRNTLHVPNDPVFEGKKYSFIPGHYLKEQHVSLGPSYLTQRYVDMAQPAIEASVWYYCTLGAEYRVEMAICTNKWKRPNVFRFPNEEMPLHTVGCDEWHKITHVFTDYGIGITKVRIIDGGNELCRIAGTCVQFLRPDNIVQSVESVFTCDT